MLKACCGCTTAGCGMMEIDVGASQNAASRLLPDMLPDRHLSRRRRWPIVPVMAQQPKSPARTKPRAKPRAKSAAAKAGAAKAGAVTPRSAKAGAAKAGRAKSKSAQTGALMANPAKAKPGRKAANAVAKGASRRVNPKSPKSASTAPRRARPKSGKPLPPPADTAAGTPLTAAATKRAQKSPTGMSSPGAQSSATASPGGGFAEAPQAALSGRPLDGSAREPLPAVAAKDIAAKFAGLEPWKRPAPATPLSAKADRQADAAAGKQRQSGAGKSDADKSSAGGRAGGKSGARKSSSNKPSAGKPGGAKKPGRAGRAATPASMLDAILMPPHERGPAALELIARQPMMAAHPIIAGTEAAYVPHRPPRPEKSEGGLAFKICSAFDPEGDQPAAITELLAGIKADERDQVLLGVTGSGKTFTMARVIQETQRPALILAPNKTLAAQLYGEFKSFFPDNAVEYFVSYYDYYQPEAYVPRTDTYIEKESSINEQIDRMRHAATRALLERDDTIIVASVSCIYGIGSVETYTAMTFKIELGERINQRQLIADLVALHYRRNDMDLVRGTFRVRGDSIELFPAHLEDRAWRFSLFGDELEAITEFDPLTGHKTDELQLVKVYANSHYVTPKPTLAQAIKSIKRELRQRLDELNASGRLLEAQRIEQRTTYDMEMMQATGSCAGIENYSRYLTGRAPGEPPPTLFEYLPDNALLFVDESHVTVPQVGAMFKGDFRRKATLAEFGFRLPSCLDNRPMRFAEWNAMRPQSVYVSATPGSWELQQTGGVFAEQVIRPTGLIDPPVEIRSARSQVDDVIDEVHRVTAQGYRTLVTTLTKRMAEDLTEYMHDQGIKVRYMHSDIDTLERIEILRDLRLGAFDVLSASTCCAKVWIFPNARWWPFSMPTRRAFSGPKHRSSRPSAGRRAMSMARSSFMPTGSPGRCSAPWMKPSAAAPNSSPIMKPMALHRNR